MRVLLVLGALPLEAHAAAADPHLRIAEALAARGHGVGVLTPVAPAGLLPPPNVTLQTVAAPRGRDVLSALRTIRALAAAIGTSCARGDIHLVHAFGWTAAAAAAWADRHGRRFTVTVECDDVALAHRVPLGTAALGWVLRRAAAVAAEFGWIAALVQRIRPAQAAVPVMPVSLLRFAMARPAEGVPHGVVYVGELVQREGLAVLLDALVLLRKNGLPLDLTVVGDGADRVELRARAIALGVPAVFAGYLPADQVRDHVAGKRVLAQPTLAPGPPGAIPEALRHGVPVVATRGGAADDLVPAEAGVLVPPGDAAAMADALRRVATDDEFLAGAYHAGTMLAVRASPARLAEQCEELYALARGRQSSGGMPARVSRQSERASRIP